MPLAKTVLYFCDDAGSFDPNAGAKYPYFYVRGGFFIDSDSDWRSLVSSYESLKDRYKFPEDGEIKWSYLWSLRKHKRLKEDVPRGRDYYWLRNYPLDRLEEFCADALRLLCSLESVRLLATVTINQLAKHASLEEVVTWHLRSQMERAEMEVQGRGLCMIFFDHGNKGVNEALFKGYSEILRDPRFISKYKHLKGVSLELSHHSVGLQLADYVAGAVNGVLCRFPFSQTLFKSHLRAKFRGSPDRIIGIGLKEVPGDTKSRKQIAELLAATDD